jgi:hypothetical protein
MEQGQSHGFPVSEEELVEVWFPIEKDADGYPESKSWEGMLSRVMSRGFLLASVPFYLKNVSKGDLVAAEEGDFLRFSHVVERGGHNTYRLLMDEASESEVRRARSELESMGLTVEVNETGILLAVDVPPFVAQQEIDAYLIAKKAAGRWQMQDGYLTSVEIT